ncbi:hypothetical protein [Maribacter sp. ACAM166]|uniref:hypothetical protein n=1 Tax=Maribacter sp. ACAM166 TaxID=2508996 RepID=UPI001485803D|nr:hypothetical protein [Maribacter sp. ACAM166]
MIKIAKAYAKDDDKNNAIELLQKGFASRYDEKPSSEDLPPSLIIAYTAHIE